MEMDAINSDDSSQSDQSREKATFVPIADLKHFITCNICSKYITNCVTIKECVHSCKYMR
jgi:hypothetical protein